MIQNQKMITNRMSGDCGKKWMINVVTIALLFCVTVVVQTNGQQQTTTDDHDNDQQSSYGVDISWPMHYGSVSTNYPWLPHNVDPVNNPVPDEYVGMAIQPLGNVMDRYEKYIQGCVDKYGGLEGKGQLCLNTERDRWEMSKRQPQSMKNYTKYGYTKIRAPEHVYTLLREFWDKNKDKQIPEKWYAGNVYTNHWESPSSMLSVEDQTLEGAGYVLKQHIWNAARDTMEAWTGYKQAECSLYGIRIYKEGAVLAPHVDRLPLVTSGIINVDQDVDELWPLEVIGHDGKAHNVTMLPGDMVLYESHSIIHGRQFPLKGRFMANVFIHFEPVGPIGGQVEYTGDLPPYVIPGSPEEANWRSRNPDGHQYLNARFTTGSTELHSLAAAGDKPSIERLLDQHENLINVRDANGWTPLHEALRKGFVETVELLLNRGADVNARVGKNAEGGSALYMAKETFKYEEDHPIVQLLVSRGAREYSPVQTEL